MFPFGKTGFALAGRVEQLGHEEDATLLWLLIDGSQ